MRKSIVLFILTLFLFQCSSVPISGRKRILLYKEDKLLPASFARYKSFMNESRLSVDIEKVTQLKRVGLKVSKSVDAYMRANGLSQLADKFEWEFNLVEDPTVNAWCLPGGKIVFYSGIMPILQNEDGIAAVMGHEIAHALAQHGNERMSNEAIKQGGGLLLAITTSQKERDTRQLLNLVYGIGSTGAILAFSRKHEKEADELGLVFMLMAGYNGEEAAEVWVRMSQNTQGSTLPRLLRTHPSNEVRIQNLKAYLPEAKKLAEQYNSQIE